MKPRFRLQCRSCPKDGRKLVKAAVCLLGEYLADESLLHDMELALTEACANVILHAYGLSPEGKVEIVVRLKPGRRLALEISDWGRPPDKLPDCEKAGPADAESGRGLFIISKLVDRQSRSCCGGKNTLVLEKDVPEQAWKPSC